MRGAPSEFWHMTLRELIGCIEAFRKSEEMRFKASWERVQNLSYMVVMPHLKKGSGMTPEKLLPLPWQKKKVNKFIPGKTGAFDNDPPHIKALRERIKNQFNLDETGKVKNSNGG